MVKSALMTTLFGAALFLVSGPGQACPSLLYKDTAGAPYAGQTMELPRQLPYKVAFLPRGATFFSKVDKHAALDYTAKHAIISIVKHDPIANEVSGVPQNAPWH